MASRTRSKRKARIGTAIAVTLLVGFVSFPLLSGVVAPFIPDTVQDPIGSQMIESTAATAPLCTDPAGRAALEHLATQLAAAAETDRHFKIYVADSDELNAFAAPGGYVVLYRGVLDNAKSANEVAGVLAHEMGHIAENHPAEGVVEALGYNIFGLLVPGSDSGAIAKTLLSSAHSRDDELDADRVGVQMLNTAGLDSHGLLGFFKTLAQEGNAIPGALQFLSTHPTGETRTARLQEYVKDGATALNAQRWRSLQGICASTGTATPITVGE